MFAGLGGLDYVTSCLADFRQHDPVGPVLILRMRPLRLYLKPGVDPGAAVSVLTDVVNAGRNVVASVPGER